MIDIKLNINTFSILIAGLYCSYMEIDPIAIPSSLFIELAEILTPYMKEWDYEKMTFEEWVRYSLVIAPIELFSESELEEAKENTIFIKRNLGNAILIATAEV